MLTNRAEHLAINKRVGGRIDQFQFQSAGLGHQPDIKVGVGFHQGLAVVCFDTGIKNGQCALTKQPVKTALAAVLQPIDFMIGQNLKTALGGDQGIDGHFLH